MYRSAAVVIYIQGLFSLAFSLSTIPTNCSNTTTQCNDYPKKFCGVECPTFAIFMVLVFGNMVASLPGILVVGIQDGNPDKTDFSCDSSISLKSYLVAGFVTTLLEIYYLKPIFSITTVILYIYAVSVTREFWLRNVDGVFQQHQSTQV